MFKSNRKAILLIGLVAAVALVLGFSAYAAAEKMTLTGEVILNDDGTLGLETADQTLLLVGDKAMELKAQVGKKVEITGPVEEVKDGDNKLTVETFKPVE